MITRPTRPTGAFRPLAEINVTPLVDVMLVLLIVFMITAPMLAAGLKVDLPKTSTAQPLAPRDPIVVTVTRDGSIALGTEIVARDDLVATVRTRIGTDDPTGAKRALHIRGDRGAPYGDVLAVIDLLAAGGLTHIALVSQMQKAPLGEAAR